jgi:hypothetical protein
LRGPKKEDRVDVRDIDPLAEHVDTEQTAKLPRTQALKRVLPL